MAVFYDFLLSKLRWGRDASDKGVFATSAALNTRWPTGKSGWHAYVENTDTTWSWDADTSAWVNSGALATPLWGNINGTLNNQTDLKNALLGKEAANANIQGHISTTGTPHVSTTEKNTWNGKTTLAAVKADADVASAISLKHTQGTDTGLDTGGANPITAATVKGHVDTTGTPHVSTAEKNAWNAMTPKLSGDVNYYIDPIAGSDSNIGTIGAPFKTIMYALGLIPQNMGGCTATIFLKDSLLYAEHVHVYNYYNGFMFIRAVNSGNVLNTVGDVVFDVFDCANVEFLGIAMKTTVNSGACVLAQMNSNVTVYSCKFSDNVNSTTTGVSVITNSKAYCTNCTDYDANKVDVGFSADTGFLFDMGSNAVGIAATSVSNGGMISDAITLKKADYDSAVSLKHAAATAGAGISVAGQQVTNTDLGSSAVSGHTGTYDHTKLHDAATAGAGISIAGQVVTCTVSPGASLPIGTIIRSSQTPGAAWHRNDGSILAQASYPLLYAQVGLLHDFSSWRKIATDANYGPIDFAEGNSVLIGGSYSHICKSIDDGENWTLIAGGHGDNHPAFIPSLDRFVIGTSTGRIYTSDDDGATWTRRDEATNPLGGNACNAAIFTGTAVLLFGAAGVIARSVDGIDWTTPASGTANALVSACIGLSSIVAVSSNTATSIYSLDDGVTWLAGRVQSTGWTTKTVVWHSSWKCFIKIGSDGDGVFQISINGIDWTANIFTQHLSHGMIPVSNTLLIGNMSGKSETWNGTGLFYSIPTATMPSDHMQNLFKTSTGAILACGNSYGYKAVLKLGYAYSTATSFRLPSPALDAGIFADSYILGD